MKTKQSPTRETGQRLTEPLPASFKPAWLFLLLIFCVVTGIAMTAYFVDRLIYG